MGSPVNAIRCSRPLVTVQATSEFLFITDSIMSSVDWRRESSARVCVCRRDDAIEPSNSKSARTPQDKHVFPSSSLWMPKNAAGAAFHSLDSFSLPLTKTFALPPHSVVALFLYKRAKRPKRQSKLLSIPRFFYLGRKRSAVLFRWPHFVRRTQHLTVFFFFLGWCCCSYCCCCRFTSLHMSFPYLFLVDSILE
jgi:hypothetical protein